jgi:GT2 family glycosyltransferase
MSHAWFRYLRYAHRAGQLLRSEGLVSLVEKARRRLGTTAFRKPRRLIILIPENDRERPIFNPVQTPRAAIIIPVYNEWRTTLRCLAALQQHTTPQIFEVIVVDDGSTDSTPGLLADCAGVTVVTLKRNQGFIAACNAGATRATAEYLVFLNNDTQVQPGWLQSLLYTFDQHPEAGLVGSRLVYPSGRQQEAGGIIFSDGSAWNYGHLDDPRKPEYSYARQPDYVSGAAFAIRRQTFLDLGGFDRAFSPAYYEDVDLAFRIRRLGQQVWYQPLSWVAHVEGGTAGIDVNSGSGAKRFQIINRERFRARWQEELGAYGHRGDGLATQKERHVKHRVFIVDTYMVRPDRDSGSVRLRNLFRLFSELDAKVTFAASNLEAPQPYASELQKAGIEVLYRPFVRSISRHLESAGLLYDLVVLCRADPASAFLVAARKYCPNARIVYDTVDLHFLRDERFAKIAQTRIAEKMAAARKKQELELVRSADTTLVVSPVERDLLARELPKADIRVLTNVHEVFGCRRGFNERNGLLFIGAFEHTPNPDAVVWFCREILPEVRKSIPEVTLTVIGANPPPEVRRLSGPRVNVTGHVEDVSEYFDCARLSIAPLRFGAGVKGKINQSLAYGLPVVATPLAAEGMPLVHGQSIAIATDPKDFADEVVRVYSNEQLWKALSSNGLKIAEAHFSLASAQHAVEELFKPSQQAPPGSPHGSPIDLRGGNGG